MDNRIVGWREGEHSVVIAATAADSSAATGLHLSRRVVNALLNHTTGQLAWRRHMAPMVQSAIEPPKVAPTLRIRSCARAPIRRVTPMRNPPEAEYTKR